MILVTTLISLFDVTAPRLIRCILLKILCSQSLIPQQLKQYQLPF